MTAGHKSYVLAADTEIEFKDWLSKLSSVLQQNKLQEEKRAASLERGKNNYWYCLLKLIIVSIDRSTPPPSPQTQSYGTLKGLEQSMNPQLMKYARETDISIAHSRKENRQKLFPLYPPICANLKSPSVTSEQIEPYKEFFGQRILLKCESIHFKLQVPIDEKDTLCQVEPYHTTLCLFDAKTGRKLTENFHFDINSPTVRSLIITSQNGVNCDTKNGSGDSYHTTTNIPSNIPQEWTMYPKQAIFSVTNPHSDIYMVVRIEKILQGSICQTSEPYIRATKDPKLGLKVQRSIAACCQRLGHYRMPFAWAAKPLFRSVS